MSGSSFRLLLISLLGSLLVLCYSQNYLYKFESPYIGNSPYYCNAQRCGIFNFVGGKTQTFPSAAKRLYNPDYFPCGLELKLICISQLDNEGNPIPGFVSMLDDVQPLFLTLPSIYNFTYCDPQLEFISSSTTTTDLPFSTVTSISDEECYPYLNCTPVTSVLTSAQVYLTNGSLLDTTLGILSLDGSFFTSSGRLVHVPRREWHFVRPGTVRINFTLSQMLWSGYAPSFSNMPAAEYLEIRFYVAGSSKAVFRHHNDNSDDDGEVPTQVFDLGSGRVVMSGMGHADQRYILTIPQLEDRLNDNLLKSYFTLTVPRFQTSYEYGGIFMHQDIHVDCDSIYY